MTFSYTAEVARDKAIVLFPTKREVTISYTAGVARDRAIYSFPIKMNRLD